MSRFGHNLGFIDELYRAYLADPGSVSEAWQEFFKDYRPDAPPAPPARPTGTASAPDKAAPGVPPADAVPLRGISARIVENMVESLEVPTATSVRTIPVKVLEENRRVINQHQVAVSGPKISFTHLIAWCILRALRDTPEMNVRYQEVDGTPHRIPIDAIHFGLAIDMEKKGQRLLLVPNIKNAGRLDFPGFVTAYDDLVERSRSDKLTVDDFAHTTVTLTNPGMIGTSLSVPRLMQGQSAIIGVGSIGYPAEYAGMAPQVISELGLSKVMTVTSTYDHRVIQGAASGRFLARLEKLLQGADRLYEDVFEQLGIPREPLEWAGDVNPQGLGGGSGNAEAIAKQASVLQLVRAYRVRGHLWADLDPLSYSPQPNPELELSTHDLTVWDLDRQFVVGGLAGDRTLATLREILDTMERTYCRHVGTEYMHIQDADKRRWLQERLESEDNTEPLPREDNIHILKRLNSAEAFETFLHTNYVGQKRFSLEGAETLIPMLDFLIEDAATAGIDEVVLGMAHRGRLNVLAHIVGKSYGKIFGEFEGNDPTSTHGSGDVKYHLGANGEYQTRSGRQVRIELASNPSHLEAVDPVVEGMARARQDRRPASEQGRIMPVLIHGDAAFAGQGVVAETLNLSALSGYSTSGAVHLVVNNQIGFTTGPADARSSPYATDVAKMVGAPIFHVNGDHPEDAVRAIRHALAFRQRFGADVVVDLVCYRRWGHNEGDDPSYTHPLLYAKIKRHRSVRKLYTEHLLRRGDFDPQTAEQALEHFRKQLREVHDQVRQAEKEPPPKVSSDDQERVVPALHTSPETAVDEALLREVLKGLQHIPEGFEAHPKLIGQLEQRGKRFDEGRIDWALAEALAFGSLVVEGVPIRLSGEDSGRGTFSQRHAILYDHRDARPYMPLANLRADQAGFQVFDSLLSEFAVLGFEYGYSVDRPEALTLWEAQFGDFSNGAQVIIDQFLTSAEEKWNQTCGLVMLLPHGYEGQGPEHSSARLERFLQLGAHGNIRVVYPSTPAQYFHMLRAQALNATKRPLVVMTPKSLLRLPACVSTITDLTQGAFRSVLDDPRDLATGKVTRLVLCTGKLYWDLVEPETSHVAVARVESLYPFPGEELDALIARYPNVQEIVWSQEEPQNMGAWTYMQERLAPRLAGRIELKRVSRRRNSSPATGSAKRHAAEQADLVEKSLGPVVPARKV